MKLMVVGKETSKLGAEDPSRTPGSNPFISYCSKTDVTN